MKVQNLQFYPEYGVPAGHLPDSHQCHADFRWPLVSLFWLSRGIQCAWSSVAAFAICPLQDILSLDNSGRINTPGVASDNWQWRFKNDDLTNELSEKLSKLTKLYFR